MIGDCICSTIHSFSIYFSSFGVTRGWRALLLWLLWPNISTWSSASVIIWSYNLEKLNGAHGWLIMIWYCPKYFTLSHFNLFHLVDKLKIAVTVCILPNQILHLSGQQSLLEKYTKCYALTNSRLSYYLQAHENQEPKSNCFQNKECISFNKTKYYEPNRSLFTVCVVLKTCPDLS